MQKTLQHHFGGSLFEEEYDLTYYGWAPSKNPCFHKYPIWSPSSI
jgi:hypothetical protein